MKKLKILILNNRLGYYGAENVLKNLVNNLDTNKYDVTLLTLTECNSSGIQNGIKYRSIFSSHSGLRGKISNKIKLLLGYERLASFYCRGYDAAVAFKMGECARLVGYSDAKKKYCWIHSNVSALEEKCSYSFTNIEEEISFFQRFDKLVAVSKACLESFVQKYGSNYQTAVIYNPVDVQDIQQKMKEEIFEQDKSLFDSTVPIIGTVARIDSQKGIDRLVYISEKLDMLDIPHRIIIVGDGVDFERYQSIIREKELKNIHLIGFRKNPYAYMSKFDVFVCSSVWESYSLVVNEALVANIPVISTKCGGPEEVLDYGKYGTLTENNQEALFEAIKAFCLVRPKNNNTYKANLSMEKFITDFEKMIGEE